MLETFDYDTYIAFRLLTFLCHLNTTFCIIFSRETGFDLRLFYQQNCFVCFSCNRVFVVLKTQYNQVHVSTCTKMQKESAFQ